MVFWFAVTAWADVPGINDGACRCWSGQTRGNDVVQAEFRLCRSGDTVSGGFDWTGNTSGRNFRVLEGGLVADPPGVLLRDVARTLDAPTPGWRFCAIDRYALRFRADGALEGTYDSEACDDHAKVLLAPTTCPAPPPVTPIPGGPRRELVPEPVQACRDRGYLWLADPDYYERTEIEDDGAWREVWQVRDRTQGRLGHLLVYPDTCRVVVGVLTPRPGAAPTFELVPPAGAPISEAELQMLHRWARVPQTR